MKISRIILIIVLFVVFFEIGLFSSYTIVNAEVPNPNELIEMQIDAVRSFFSPDNVGGLLIKDPDAINVTNRYDLADKLADKAEVDGVNVENMTITTSDDTDNDPFNTTVTAFGYSTPKGNSNSIVISGEPDYKISASVNIIHSIDGYEADLDTLNIESILKVYDSNDAKQGNYTTYDSGPSGSSQSYSYSSDSSSSGNTYISSGSSSSSSSSSSSDSGSSYYSESTTYDDGASSSGGSSQASTSESSGDVVINLLNPIFLLFNH